MPTAVVDRPHSRLTDTVAAQHRRQGPPSPRPVVESDRPACAACPELFGDPVLEQEPAASAPARVRQRYSVLAAEATAVCASCPLLSDCLYRAVVDYDVAGLVAGTTERQRTEVRARLGLQIEPADLDSLAGVVGGQRTVDHDEVVRLRRAHPDESLERIARRLGCSLSTVKRHLRRERNQPSAATAAARPKPTRAQVREATGEILAGHPGARRAAA